MTKKELRAHYKHLRKTLAPGVLDRYSDQICDVVLSNFQLGGKYVSLFLPIERHQEINTYKLWEKAVNLDAHVAVPKANFETHDMKHILFENENQLEINHYGIPEPKKGRVIAADRFDYVFVPLLAVDMEGHRVGYGRGFYDRFLRKCAPGCQFIGLHLFDVEDRIDDVLPTDIRLHACVTPERLIRFGN